jgi:Raf kinase inhibitor-like YbhB/YbcL family protein
MQPKDSSSFQLTSSAFADGGMIPDKYTCKGEGVNPPLEIHGEPDGTDTYALVVHDPDAPGGDFLHWTVWNLPDETTTIPENASLDNANQGANDFGKTGYGAPCPPSGTHRHTFELYAFDNEPSLQNGTSRSDLQSVIDNHKVAETSLTGLVSKD